MTSSYQVRSAVVNDADALAPLMVESWQFAYEGLLPAEFLKNLSVQERAESLRKVILFNETSDFSDTRLVYAESDPESILGVCSSGLDRTDGSVGEIYALYVSPALIGTGLGRILMQDAVVQLASMGFKVTYLWVLEGNERAIGFYKKAGFALTGETKTEQLGEIPLNEN